MMYQKIHKSSSWNSPSQGKSSQFAPRPFAVQAQQDSRRPPTQIELENEAFKQNKFEAFGLQMKEKHGAITSVEQKKLGMLQAKMDDFWTQRMERAKAQPNLLEILIRNSQAIQAAESQPPVQSNMIQVKSDAASDRPDSSLEQRPNKTGMPDALKAGVESLSGYSLDDVRVYYNSVRPAQLQALAYTQGTEIHVASGQEEHLPHEAWHVVQQAQGRVKPTMQMKEGAPINDDAGLEQEADVMGANALATAAHCPATSSTAMVVNRQLKAVGQHGVQRQIQRKLMPRLSIAADLAHYPDIRKSLFTEETLKAFPGPRQLSDGSKEDQNSYKNDLMNQDLEHNPNINYRPIQESKKFSNDSLKLVRHIKGIIGAKEMMFLLKGEEIGIANKVDETYVHPRIFGGMPDVDMAGTVTDVKLDDIPIGGRDINKMSEMETRKALMGLKGEITFTNNSGHFKFDTISNKVQQMLTKQVKESKAPDQKGLMEDVQVKFKKGF